MSISAEALAATNAVMNALSGVCLTGAFIAIKRRNVGIHWKLMVSAVGASTLFLVGYLTRMWVYGSKHFGGEGTIRTVYFVILISHMILAAGVVPLVGTTLFFAIRKRFDRHRRIARITFPIWAYVSLTGVIVYLMLYHLPA